MPKSRPRRADAIRNRALILEAAEAVFSEQGSGASVAEIAQRAGTGKGTVFRHFTSKDELLAHVMLARLDKLIDDGEQLEATVGNGQALYDFLELGAGRQQEDFAPFLTAPGIAEQLQGAQQRFFELMERLAADAHRVGTLRSDMSGADVAALMCAPGHVAQMAGSDDPNLWRRYLTIIIDGLRPVGASFRPES